MTLALAGLSAWKRVSGIFLCFDGFNVCFLPAGRGRWPALGWSTGHWGARRDYPGPRTGLAKIARRTAPQPINTAPVFRHWSRNPRRGHAVAPSHSCRQRQRDPRRRLPGGGAESAERGRASASTIPRKGPTGACLARGQFADSRLACGTAPDWPMARLPGD